jgi:hypothetical protein
VAEQAHSTWIQSATVNIYAKSKLSKVSKQRFRLLEDKAEFLLVNPSHFGQVQFHRLHGLSVGHY